MKVFWIDLTDETEGDDTEYFDPKQLLGLAPDASKTSASETDSIKDSEDSDEEE